MTKCLLFHIIFILIHVIINVFTNSKADERLLPETEHETCDTCGVDLCYHYTQNETKLENRTLLQHLIINCGYDKLRPPTTPPNEPLKVYLKLYFYYLKSYEAHDLQFTVYMLMQSRFIDTRLQFDPSLFNTTTLIGTQSLVNQIWTPHLYLRNERVSHVMGDGRDVMIHIYHDGTVLYTKRIMTTLFCWMKLHKFPFDSQECSLQLESWSYNMSNLELFWEDEGPILCRNELSLTEFRVIGRPSPSKITSNITFDLNPSDDFHGNYSSLLVTFYLKRESGFYIYDYFFPSILLVVVSWVSFWLEADQIPARVAIGSSTMLTFIILALQTGNSVPKVSYIKSSEVWFLICSAFIFGSLVEFAFVNTIFRSRRPEIALKKLNSKYILRETLTPKASRRNVLERSHSCPDNHGDKPVVERGAFVENKHHQLLADDNRLQFKSSSSLPNVSVFEIAEEIDNKKPIWSTVSSRFLVRRKNTRRHWSPFASKHPSSFNNNKKSRKRRLKSLIRRTKKNKSDFKEHEQQPTRMTPQQIAKWIDVRSQILFPLTFIIFNIFFWIHTYIF